MADSPKTKTLTLKTGGARRRTDVRQPIQRSGPRARAASQRQLEQQQPAARARGEAPRPSEKPRRHLRAPGIEPQPLTPYLDETFAVFAPCPSGLEQALSDELNELGFDQVRPGRGGCSFTADWAGVMRANLYSRLSTRILVQVAHGPVKHEDDLLELARRTPWERWFGPEHSLRVDTSAIRSPMRSLQYCTLRTKDGICDRLRELEGARPSIDTVRPDARVHVFLSESTATLYLDSSGESLFKRGWRFDKGEAPLRENLAAGLLKLAGWHGTSSLMDPFCGSGTILIEAAYIALRIPPGLNRPFAFERLRQHDAERWQQLKNQARTRIKPDLEISLIGSDTDPEAIAAARRNAQRAGLADNLIEFEVRDVRDIRPTMGAPGDIVTNPPYGARLGFARDPAANEEVAHNEAGSEVVPSEVLELWQAWSHTLKAHFAGWKVCVITNDRLLPRHLRLAATRRTPLYNGAIECRFFTFEVRDGSYRLKL